MNIGLGLIIELYRIRFYKTQLFYYPILLLEGIICSIIFILSQDYYFTL